METHWAGPAHLRVEGSQQLRGFGQVVAADGDGWSGRFFAAERLLSMPARGEVELLLPGEVVAPAIAEFERDGLYALQGTAPSPSWTELTTGRGHEDDLPETVQREGYFESRGGSRITLENWIPVSAMPQMPPGTRWLIDYRPVKEILVPFDWFLEAGRELAAMGVRVAVVAEHPVVFGVSRQTIQAAGIEEGDQFAVFREYVDAAAWLLR
jgi:hypothetical protein